MIADNELPIYVFGSIACISALVALMCKNYGHMENGGSELILFAFVITFSILLTPSIAKESSNAVILGVVSTGIATSVVAFLALSFKPIVEWSYLWGIISGGISLIFFILWMVAGINDEKEIGYITTMGLLCWFFWFCFVLFIDIKWIVSGKNTFITEIKRNAPTKHPGEILELPKIPFENAENDVMAVMKLYVDTVFILIVMIQILTDR